MTRSLRRLRPVYVVGIGLRRYQRPSETAGAAWRDVESAYCGTAMLGMAPARILLRHLGASGLAVTRVENASASGSTAVSSRRRMASGVSVSTVSGRYASSPRCCAVSVGTRRRRVSTPSSPGRPPSRPTRRAGVGPAEAMGLCGEGEAVAHLRRGDFDIGGRVAVSPSGGLLAMGHPTGPTGAGQIVEIARQLRREAAGRQQQNARTGLAHMVGVGAVCAVHVLQVPAGEDGGKTA